MKIMTTDKALAKLDEIYPLVSSQDLVKYARIFSHELIAALHNQPSSLPSILNPIYKALPSPGFGVAVSIGGTNGYVSSFCISKKGKITFFNREFFVLPIDTSKDQLFELITKHVFSVAKNRKRAFPIGIGMAYPLKPLCNNGSLDGELLYMSKGRNINGLVGKIVGREYTLYLSQKHKRNLPVTVANDAVCLLLGGQGIEIAGVVGTGLNFAYWERREMIAPLRLTPINNFAQTEVAVNIEAKNFDKIAGSRLREAVDRKSSDRGYSLAEKEAAGAYLYQIFNAGKIEIIGKTFPDLSSTDELNDILTSAKPSSPEYIFTQRIFHRSAQIVAVELCGILQKIHKTRGVVPIVMEGGIFWKAKNYPALVNLYINMILPEIIPSFARLFGSSRRGIAILARYLPS